MKTIIRVNKIELIRNNQEILLIKSGKIFCKFDADQLMPAITGFLALTQKKKNMLSGDKVMRNFQASLF